MNKLGVQRVRNGLRNVCARALEFCTVFGHNRDMYNFRPFSACVFLWVCMHEAVVLGTTILYHALLSCTVLWDGAFCFQV